MTIKIGDKLFKSRDTYRAMDRRYEEVTVLGETSRSWVIGSSLEYAWLNFKVPKKAPFSTGKIFTKQMVDESNWIQDHRHKVIEAARYADYATLKKIAEIIGYEKPRTNVNTHADKQVPHNSSTRTE